MVWAGADLDILGSLDYSETDSSLPRDCDDTCRESIVAEAFDDGDAATYRDGSVSLSFSLSPLVLLPAEGERCATVLAGIDASLVSAGGDRVVARDRVFRSVTANPERPGRLLVDRRPVAGDDPRIDAQSELGDIDGDGVLDGWAAHDAPPVGCEPREGGAACRGRGLPGTHGSVLLGSANGPVSGSSLADHGAERDPTIDGAIEVTPDLCDRLASGARWTWVRTLGHAIARRRDDALVVERTAERFTCAGAVEWVDDSEACEDETWSPAPPTPRERRASIPPDDPPARVTVHLDTSGPGLEPPEGCQPLGVFVDRTVIDAAGARRTSTPLPPGQLGATVAARCRDCRVTAMPIHTSDGDPTTHRVALDARELRLYAEAASGTLSLPIGWHLVQLEGPDGGRVFYQVRVTSESGRIDLP